MGSYEDTTHSFVVKVWLEETPEEAGRALWRGYITHVQSGERRYFRNFDSLTTFITTYLIRMGVKPSTRYRMRQWLSRLKMFPKL